jgi:monovalent cation:H+ antiporter-2, CPA2 family
LMSDRDYQIFLAASVISMIATPFLISAAPSVGVFVQSYLGDGHRGEIENVEEDDIHMTSSGGLHHHVIVVGYGLNGRNLARVLRAVSIPYLVLDLDAETVRRARSNGEKINFGDATRREVLHHAHIFEASALVLAMSDARAARRTVRQARLMSKELHIIVRTRYVSEITELLAIGADEVIPEEFETSIEIFARVLQRYGIARSVIEAQIDRIRKQGYEMLRTTSLPAPSSPIGMALEAANSQTVTIETTSPAAGRSLGELDLRGESGATVIAVIRGGQTKVTPGANYKLEPGDTVVLLGNQAKIERARDILEPAVADAAAGFNP